MATEDYDNFILRLSFPKTPKVKKERELYRGKFKAWIDQERKSMPFDKLISSGNQIDLTSDEFLFHADFGRIIRTVIATKKPEKNLDKLNETANRIFSYLNTIMTEIVTQVKVESEFVLSQKEDEKVARKIIGESKIAKIAEILKTTWNPLGILFTWKSDSRDNLAMCTTLEKESMTFFLSYFTWKNNIPSDAILAEKREFLKFKDTMSKLTKEDLNHARPEI